jgi:hypothetical protein
MAAEFVVFVVGVGGMERGRASVLDLIKTWNRRLRDSRSRLRLEQGYGPTGNLLLFSARDLTVRAVFSILSEEIARDKFAVFTVKEFLFWLSELLPVLTSSPKAPLSRRVTPGAVMHVDPEGGIPRLPPNREFVAFSPFARPRVRGAWRLDRLASDGYTRDRDQREGGWGAVSSIMKKVSGGVWTARSARTLKGLAAATVRPRTYRADPTDKPLPGRSDIPTNKDESVPRFPVSQNEHHHGGSGAMARIGEGYGSECHLLRYLGRHRDLLNARVLKEVSGRAICWLDFRFDPAKKWPDAEWKGLDFLANDEEAQRAWRDFWPQSGNVPNWDAVARVTTTQREEWLLVEAKAHLGELRSSCWAKPEGGLMQITRALDITKRALGVSADRNWLTGYYQYCNRLAVLNVLNSHGTPARLLLIYFFGDAVPAQECPQDEVGWADALEAQAQHVALPRKHPLADRIHKLFLPVAG